MLKGGRGEGVAGRGGSRRKQSYSICAAVQKYLGKNHFWMLFPLHGTILTYVLIQYIVTIVSQVVVDE